MRQPWKDLRFEGGTGVGRIYDGQGQGAKPEGVPGALRAWLEPGGISYVNYCSQAQRARERQTVDCSRVGDLSDGQPTFEGVGDSGYTMGNG